MTLRTRTRAARERVCHRDVVYLTDGLIGYLDGLSVEKRWQAIHDYLMAAWRSGARRSHAWARRDFAKRQDGRP